jgi:3',5'-cyclic AMP phosphodiesterase CpdA
MGFAARQNGKAKSGKHRFADRIAQSTAACRIMQPGIAQGRESFAEREVASMNRREAMASIAAGAAAIVAAPNRGQLVAAEQASRSARRRTARFAHFTDTHVYSKRNAAQGLAAAIQHVHALPDRPDFILNGGDAIYDALETSRESAESQWSLWKSAWNEHGSLPVRHCLGNHDIWGWDKAKSQTTGQEAGWGKQLALDQLGLEKSYYAYDEGGWRLMVLDSLSFDEQTAYRAELDEAQWDWLIGELKSTPATTPVAIISHVPILTVGTIGFTPELRKHPDAVRMLSHNDAYELLNLLGEHANVKLCLSGHTHLSETVRFGSIDFVNSGAVSGLWWKGHFRHTAEGYNLVDLFDDGTWSTQYVSYGWNAAG